MVKRTWNERHWTEDDTDTLDIDEGWALDSFEDHDIELEVTHDTHGRTQARRRLSSIERFALTGVVTMDRISQRWHSRLGDGRKQSERKFEMNTDTDGIAIGLLYDTLVAVYLSYLCMAYDARHA